jgi:membrane-bound lytic murein transglycosylase B
MVFVKLVVISSIILVSSISAATPAKWQQEFVDLMVTKHQFERTDVENTLARATKNQDILNAITKPWEAKPWHQYYPIFLTEKRLTKGLAFWQTHQVALERAEQETGVPAEIIVAIIGVESFYGTYTGKYAVLDALVTLGFHYPRRASFFRKELAELFLLAQEEQFDITQLNGSYAGAMGWGQFIPSSYRHYAVDFDQDGVRDLFNNPVDAIGSVANYFKKNGWQTNADVAYPAQVSGDKYKKALTKSRKLSHTWAELQAMGVSQTQTELVADTSVKLLEFNQQTSKEYWIALKNFYVITRYNHSPLYAMVIFQFSQQLKNTFIQQNAQKNVS